MAKVTLNDRKLKSLKPAPAGKRYDLMDSIVPGFGVRVTDKGQRTFILVARYAGSKHPTRRAIGEYGVITIDDARARAREWLELIRKGVDPQRHEENQRRENQRRQVNSFNLVAEEFIRLSVIGPDPEKPKQRRGHLVAREIRREFIDRWEGRPVTEITSHDVLSIIDEAVERGAPYQAHSLLGHVRRLFNWAIARGVYGLERSPCDRMKPREVIGKKALRTRVLADDELRALWRASGKLGYPWGPMFQMLALTGQRKSEVAEASWSEFDLRRKLWIIPAERMKSDAPHVVPLTDEVIALLGTLPRFKKGDYLFTTTFGEKPVAGFSKAKVRLDRTMLRSWRALGRVSGENRRKGMMADWRIHDIRRTMRTHLSALPVSDLVRELVIAHAKPGLHRVYDQHAYETEKRHALQLWAGRLDLIVRPPAANVIPLAAARIQEAEVPLRNSAHG